MSLATSCDVFSEETCTCVKLCFDEMVDVLIPGSQNSTRTESTVDVLAGSNTYADTTTVNVGSGINDADAVLDVYPSSDSVIDLGRILSGYGFAEAVPAHAVQCFADLAVKIAEEDIADLAAMPIHSVEVDLVSMINNTGNEVVTTLATSVQMEQFGSILGQDLPTNDPNKVQQKLDKTNKKTKRGKRKRTKLLPTTVNNTLDSPTTSDGDAFASLFNFDDSNQSERVYQMGTSNENTVVTVVGGYSSDNNTNEPIRVESADYIARDVISRVLYEARKPKSLPNTKRTIIDDVHYLQRSKSTSVVTIDVDSSEKPIVKTIQEVDDAIIYVGKPIQGRIKPNNNAGDITSNKINSGYTLNVEAPCFTPRIVKKDIPATTSLLAGLSMEYKQQQKKITPVVTELEKPREVIKLKQQKDVPIIVETIKPRPRTTMNPSYYALTDRCGYDPYYYEAEPIKASTSKKSNPNTKLMNKPKASSITSSSNKSSKSIASEEDTLDDELTTTSISEESERDLSDSFYIPDTIIKSAPELLNPSCPPLDYEDDDFEPVYNVTPSPYLSENITQVPENDTTINKTNSVTCSTPVFNTSVKQQKKQTYRPVENLSINYVPVRIDKTADTALVEKTPLVCTTNAENVTIIKAGATSYATSCNGYNQNLVEKNNANLSIVTNVDNAIAAKVRQKKVVKFSHDGYMNYPTSYKRIQPDPTKFDYVVMDGNKFTIIFCNFKAQPIYNLSKVVEKSDYIRDCISEIKRKLKIKKTKVANLFYAEKQQHVDNQMCLPYFGLSRSEYKDLTSPINNVSWFDVPNKLKSAATSIKHTSASIKTVIKSLSESGLKPILPLSSLIMSESTGIPKQYKYCSGKCDHHKDDSSHFTKVLSVDDTSLHYCSVGNLFSFATFFFLIVLIHHLILSYHGSLLSSFILSPTFFCLIFCYFKSSIDMNLSVILKDISISSLLLPVVYIFRTFCKSIFILFLFVFSLNYVLTQARPHYIESIPNDSSSYIDIKPLLYLLIGLLPVKSLTLIIRFIAILSSSDRFFPLTSWLLIGTIIRTYIETRIKLYQFGIILFTIIFCVFTHSFSSLFILMILTILVAYFIYNKVSPYHMLHFVNNKNCFSCFKTEFHNNATGFTSRRDKVSLRILRTTEHCCNLRTVDTVNINNLSIEQINRERAIRNLSSIECYCSEENTAFSKNKPIYLVNGHRVQLLDDICLCGQYFVHSCIHTNNICIPNVNKSALLAMEALGFNLVDHFKEKPSGHILLVIPNSFTPSEIPISQEISPEKLSVTEVSPGCLTLLHLTNATIYIYRLEVPISNMWINIDGLSKVIDDLRNFCTPYILVPTGIVNNVLIENVLHKANIKCHSYKATYTKYVPISEPINKYVYGLPSAQTSTAISIEASIISYVEKFTPTPKANPKTEIIYESDSECSSNIECETISSVSTKRKRGGKKWKGHNEKLRLNMTLTTNHDVITYSMKDKDLLLYTEPNGNGFIAHYTCLDFFERPVYTTTRHTLDMPNGTDDIYQFYLSDVASDDSVIVYKSGNIKLFANSYVTQFTILEEIQLQDSTHKFVGAKHIKFENYTIPVICYQSNGIKLPNGISGYPIGGRPIIGYDTEHIFVSLYHFDMLFDINISHNPVSNSDFNVACALHCYPDQNGVRENHTNVCQHSFFIQNRIRTFAFFRQYCPICLFYTFICRVENGGNKRIRSNQTMPVIFHNYLGLIDKPYYLICSIIGFRFNILSVFTNKNLRDNDITTDKIDIDIKNFQDRCNQYVVDIRYIYNDTLTPLPQEFIPGDISPHCLLGIDNIIMGVKPTITENVDFMHNSIHCFLGESITHSHHCLGCGNSFEHEHIISNIIGLQHSLMCETCYIEHTSANTIQQSLGLDSNVDFENSYNSAIYYIHQEVAPDIDNRIVSEIYKSIITCGVPAAYIDSESHDNFLIGDAQTPIATTKCVAPKNVRTAFNIWSLTDIVCLLFCVLLLSVVQVSANQDYCRDFTLGNDVLNLTISNGNGAIWFHDGVHLHMYTTQSVATSCKRYAWTNPFPSFKTICDKTMPAGLTHGHMLPNTRGGPSKLFNCLPQTEFQQNCVSINEGEYRGILHVYGTSDYTVSIGIKSIVCCKTYSYYGVFHGCDNNSTKNMSISMSLNIGFIAAKLHHLSKLATDIVMSIILNIFDYLHSFTDRIHFYGEYFTHYLKCNKFEITDLFNFSIDKLKIFDNLVNYHDSDILYPCTYSTNYTLFKTGCNVINTDSQSTINNLHKDSQYTTCSNILDTSVFNNYTRILLYDIRFMSSNVYDYLFSNCRGATKEIILLASPTIFNHLVTSIKHPLDFLNYTNIHDNCYDNLIGYINSSTNTTYRDIVDKYFDRNVTHRYNFNSIFRHKQNHPMCVVLLSNNINILSSLSSDISNVIINRTCHNFVYTNDGTTNLKTTLINSIDRVCLDNNSCCLNIPNFTNYNYDIGLILHSICDKDHSPYRNIYIFMQMLINTKPSENANSFVDNTLLDVWKDDTNIDTVTSTISRISSKVVSVYCDKLTNVTSNETIKSESHKVYMTIKNARSFIMLVTYLILVINISYRFGMTIFAIMQMFMIPHLVELVFSISYLQPFTNHLVTCISFIFTSVIIIKYLGPRYYIVLLVFLQFGNSYAFNHERANNLVAELSVHTEANIFWIIYLYILEAFSLYCNYINSYVLTQYNVYTADIFNPYALPKYICYMLSMGTYYFYDEQVTRFPELGDNIYHALYNNEGLNCFIFTLSLIYTRILSKVFRISRDTCRKIICTFIYYQDPDTNVYEQEIYYIGSGCSTQFSILLNCVFQIVYINLYVIIYICFDYSLTSLFFLSVVLYLHYHLNKSMISTLTQVTYDAIPKIDMNSTIKQIFSAYNSIYLVFFICLLPNRLLSYFVFSDDSYVYYVRCHVLTILVILIHFIYNTSTVYVRGLFIKFSLAAIFNIILLSTVFYTPSNNIDIVNCIYGHINVFMALIPVLYLLGYFTYCRLINTPDFIEDTIFGFIYSYRNIILLMVCVIYFPIWNYAAFIFEYFSINLPVLNIESIISYLCLLLNNYLLYFMFLLVAFIHIRYYQFFFRIFAYMFILLQGTVEAKILIFHHPEASSGSDDICDIFNSAIGSCNHTYIIMLLCTAYIIIMYPTYYKSFAFISIFILTLLQKTADASLPVHHYSNITKYNDIQYCNSIAMPGLYPRCISIGMFSFKIIKPYLLKVIALIIYQHILKNDGHTKTERLFRCCILYIFPMYIWSLMYISKVIICNINKYALKTRTYFMLIVSVLIFRINGAMCALIRETEAPIQLGRAIIFAYILFIVTFVRYLVHRNVQIVILLLLMTSAHGKIFSGNCDNINNCETVIANSQFDLCVRIRTNISTQCSMYNGIYDEYNVYNKPSSFLYNVTTKSQEQHLLSFDKLKKILSRRGILFSSPSSSTNALIQSMVIGQSTDYVLDSIIQPVPIEESNHFSVNLLLGSYEYFARSHEAALDIIKGLMQNENSVLLMKPELLDMHLFVSNTTIFRDFSLYLDNNTLHFRYQLDGCKYIQLIKDQLFYFSLLKEKIVFEECGDLFLSNDTTIQCTSGFAIYCLEQPSNDTNFNINTIKVNITSINDTFVLHQQHSVSKPKPKVKKITTQHGSSVTNCYTHFGEHICTKSVVLTQHETCDEVYENCLSTLNGTSVKCMPYYDLCRDRLIYVDAPITSDYCMYSNDPICVDFLITRDLSVFSYSNQTNNHNILRNPSSPILVDILVKHIKIIMSTTSPGGQYHIQYPNAGIILTSVPCTVNVDVCLYNIIIDNYISSFYITYVFQGKILYKHLITHTVPFKMDTYKFFTLYPSLLDNDYESTVVSSSNCYHRAYCFSLESIRGNIHCDDEGHGAPTNMVCISSLPIVRGKFNYRIISVGFISISILSLFIYMLVKRRDPIIYMYTNNTIFWIIANSTLLITFRFVLKTDSSLDGMFIHLLRLIYMFYGSRHLLINIFHSLWITLLSQVLFLFGSASSSNFEFGWFSVLTLFKLYSFSMDTVYVFIGAKILDALIIQFFIHIVSYFISRIFYFSTEFDLSSPFTLSYSAAHKYHADNFTHINSTLDTFTRIQNIPIPQWTFYKQLNDYVLRKPSESENFEYKPLTLKMSGSKVVYFAMQSIFRVKQAKTSLIHDKLTGLSTPTCISLRNNQQHISWMTCCTYDGGDYFAANKHSFDNFNVLAYNLYGQNHTIQVNDKTLTFGDTLLIPTTHQQNISTLEFVNFENLFTTYEYIAGYRLSHTTQNYTPCYIFRNRIASLHGIKGDCGLPYIGRDKEHKCVILGIHSLGLKGYKNTSKLIWRSSSITTLVTDNLNLEYPTYIPYNAVSALAFAIGKNMHKTKFSYESSKEDAISRLTNYVNSDNVPYALDYYQSKLGPVKFSTVLSHALLSLKAGPDERSLNDISSYSSTDELSYLTKIATSTLQSISSKDDNTNFYEPMSIITPYFNFILCIPLFYMLTLYTNGYHAFMTCLLVRHNRFNILMTTVLFAVCNYYSIFHNFYLYTISTEMFVQVASIYGSIQIGCLFTTFFRLPFKFDLLYVLLNEMLVKSLIRTPLSILIKISVIIVWHLSSTDHLYNLIILLILFITPIRIYFKYGTKYTIGLIISVLTFGPMKSFRIRPKYNFVDTNTYQSSAMSQKSLRYWIALLHQISNVIGAAGLDQALSEILNELNEITSLPTIEKESVISIQTKLSNYYHQNQSKFSKYLCGNNDYIDALQPNAVLQCVNKTELSFIKSVAASLNSPLHGSDIDPQKIYDALGAIINRLSNEINTYDDEELADMLIYFECLTPVYKMCQSLLNSTFKLTYDASFCHLLKNRFEKMRKIRVDCKNEQVKRNTDRAHVKRIKEAIIANMKVATNNSTKFQTFGKTLVRHIECLRLLTKVKNSEPSELSTYFEQLSHNESSHLPIDSLLNWLHMQADGTKVCQVNVSDCVKLINGLDGYYYFGGAMKGDCDIPIGCRISSIDNICGLNEISNYIKTMRTDKKNLIIEYNVNTTPGSVPAVLINKLPEIIGGNTHFYSNDILTDYVINDNEKESINTNEITYSGQMCQSIEDENDCIFFSKKVNAVIRRKNNRLLYYVGAPTHSVLIYYKDPFKYSIPTSYLGNVNTTVIINQIEEDYFLLMGFFKNKMLTTDDGGRLVVQLNDGHNQLSLNNQSSRKLALEAPTDPINTTIFQDKIESVMQQSISDELTTISDMLTISSNDDNYDHVLLQNPVKRNVYNKIHQSRPNYIKTDTTTFPLVPEYDIKEYQDLDVTPLCTEQAHNHICECGKHFTHVRTDCIRSDVLQKCETCRSKSHFTDYTARNVLNSVFQLGSR